MKYVVALGLVVSMSACTRITVDSREDGESSSDTSAASIATSLTTVGEEEAESIEAGEEFGDDEATTEPPPPLAHHWLLARFDMGEEVWSLVGPEGWVATAAAAHPDGGSVLAVRQWDDEDPPKLLRFAASGEQVQETEVEPSAWIRDLAVDGEGRVYLAGDLSGELFVAAYTADFAEHWPKRTTTTVSSGVARRAHIALAPDGTLVYADSTERSTSMRKLDANGDPSWSSAWPGPAAPDAFGELADLVVSAQGTIVLAIATGDAESGDLWLDAYDQGGTELWAVSHLDTSTTGVAATGAGTIVAAGLENPQQTWIGGWSDAGMPEWELRLDEVAGLGPIRGCPDGFVLTLEGARVYSEAGRELAALAHDPQGGAVVVLDAFCTSDGSVMLVATATAGG